MKCSVLNCKNKVKFKFPSNSNSKEMWLKAIRRPTFVPRSRHGLCIEHFDPNDVIKESYRDGYQLQNTRLRQGAIPIIFPWQKHSSDQSEVESSTGVQVEQQQNHEGKEVADNNPDSNRYTQVYAEETSYESSQHFDYNVDDDEVSTADTFHEETASPSQYFDNTDDDEMSTADTFHEETASPSQYFDNTDDDEMSTADTFHEESVSTSELFDNSANVSNDADIEIEVPEENNANNQCDIGFYEEVVCSDVVYTECNEASDYYKNIEQNNVKEEKRSMSTQTMSGPRYTIADFKNKPKSLLHFTGLEDYEKFLTVLYSLGPRVYHIKYVRSTIGNLGIPDQLFLVLWKLRRYPSDIELAEHFNIPETAVGNIFISWIIFMSKTRSVIDLWPSRQLIDFYMPETFKQNYPTARVIMDGTEFKTEALSNPRQKQSSFSTYKNATTQKVVAGGSPGGLITYCSPAYGGSASDRQIVERSNLFTQCQAGDTIIGDKGFLVQDLFAPYDVTVATPTPLVSGSIPHKTVMKDRKLSKHRVHIERLIGLLKSFTILSKKLNHYYIPLTSEIVGVCVMLTNFKENIMKAKGLNSSLFFKL